jgi:hypothetical protein
MLKPFAAFWVVVVVTIRSPCAFPERARVYFSQFGPSPFVARQNPTTLRCVRFGGSWFIQASILSSAGSRGWEPRSPTRLYSVVLWTVIIRYSGASRFALWVGPLALDSAVRRRSTQTTQPS